MAAEPHEKPMSLEEFAANAAALYERMAREGGSVVIEQDDLLFTVRPKRQRARKRKRHFTEDDPFFEMAGIANSGGPGDVATNKHKYLADAYADLHDAQPS